MTTVPLSPSRKSLSSSFSHSSGLNRPTSGNVRNSEINNPMRRSFTGTPFSKPSSIVANQRFSGGGGRGGFNHNTPVTSPSDHPQRSSREIKIISFHDHEDKENGRDQNLNPARFCSPAASSKGVKNFMSPTISAASKVNQSPRKVVLGDKNESVRTSVSSLSEVKGTSMDESDLKAVKSHSQKKGVSFDTEVTYIENKESVKSNKEVFGDPDADTTTKDHSDSWLVNSENVDKDLVNIDPSFEIGPRTSNPVRSPVLAPLDADPSLPPYDPKTNYISPRPQFLLYKPNPRLELYKESKQLEDIFATQSFTDTEVTEDETKSEDSDKESEDAASSCVVTKEEMLSKVNSGKIPEVVAEAKTASKRKSVTKRGFIGILLVLAAVGMWMSFINPPVMEQDLLNNVSFPSRYVSAEISDFMRSNFQDLSQKFQRWLHETHAHISSMMISIVEQHKISHYANLSTLAEDGLLDGYGINHFTLGGETTYSDNVRAMLIEQERYIDLFQDEEDWADEFDESVEESVGYEESGGLEAETEGTECEEFSVEEDVADEFGENLEESVGHEDSQRLQAEIEGVEHEEFLVEVEDQVPEESIIALKSEVEQPAAGEDKTVEVSGGLVFKESDMIPQLGEVEPVAKEAEEMEMQTSLQIAPISEAAFDTQAEVFDGEARSSTKTAYPTLIIPETILESSGLALNKLKGEFSLETMILGIALIISTLLAVVALGAFVYLKIAYPTLQQIPVSAAAHPMTVSSKPDRVAKTITNEHGFHERSSTNDMVSEQCPSETSSSQFPSFNSNRVLDGSIIAQSQEHKPTKNQRRESLDTSDCSMSPSYGSFTTYERIPIKTGNGEQEMVTPVRRSSRIRNQVTST